MNVYAFVSKFVVASEQLLTVLLYHVKGDV